MTAVWLQGPVLVDMQVVCSVADDFSGGGVDGALAKRAYAPDLSQDLHPQR
mgnify:FL=1